MISLFVGLPLVLRTTGSHWGGALEFEDSASFVGVANKAAYLQNRGGEANHHGKEQLDAGLVGSLFGTLPELAADTVGELGHGAGDVGARPFGLSHEVGQRVHIRSVHAF